MKEHAYFDNAATTWPKPEVVYAFMDSFFRTHGVNPGRSGSLLALEAEQMISECRSMLADFFGFCGSSRRVIFTLNGTDALNMAITGLVSPGDHIITTRLEHNAVLRTVNHMERDKQLQVTRISPGGSGYIDAASIKSAIQTNTRAIVLTHASNVYGTVQPVADIAQLTRTAGLSLIVDAAQTAGVLPIDMDDQGISVLTFPGHKGLFGPMGIGGLLIAESVDLVPQRFGGTGVNSLSTYQPEEYPYRLEAGTLPLPGIAGLHAAQLWFRQLGSELSGNHASTMDHAALCRVALAHIHQVELAHIERIETKLRQFPSVRILADAQMDARVATISFTVDGVETERIADQLDADHQICARAGLHCAPSVHVDAKTVEIGGAIRLSPGFFTDEEDMQQLLNALDEILG